jgi:hypothetical protein
MKQGSEKVDSLAGLSTLQELHDDPKTRFRLPCRAGTKSVRSTCVRKDAPVTVTLESSVSVALNKVRERLLARGGQA